MQALESPGASDDKQWLTYWTVFAGLTTLESIALPLLVRCGCQTLSACYDMG